MDLLNISEKRSVWDAFLVLQRCTASKNHEASISLDYLGTKKTWLLTMFEEDASTKTMNTGTNHKSDLSGDSLATLQQTSSAGKGTNNSAKFQFGNLLIRLYRLLYCSFSVVAGRKKM